MTVFPPADRWTIPRTAWAVSLQELARDGANGSEGVALWLGRRHGSVGEVTRVVILRGSGVTRQPRFLQISAALLNDVTDVAIATETVLVGQIHSHGPRSPVDLSETDRKYGITHPGYLSIVAPDYGLRPFTLPIHCGVHVFVDRIGFVRLGAREVVERIVLVDTPADAPDFVGGDGDS